MDKEQDSLFIRKVKTSFSPDKRALLIRAGTLMFNQGNIEEAKRVFLTINYSSGLKRIGDYYLRNGNPIEAMKMFYHSSSSSSFKELAKTAAESIHHLIKGNDKRS